MLSTPNPQYAHGISNANEKLAQSSELLLHTRYGSGSDTSSSPNIFLMHRSPYNSSSFAQNEFNNQATQPAEHPFHLDSSDEGDQKMAGGSVVMASDYQQSLSSYGSGDERLVTGLLDQGRSQVGIDYQNMNIDANNYISNQSYFAPQQTNDSEPLSYTDLSVASSLNNLTEVKSNSYAESGNTNYEKFIPNALTYSSMNLYSNNPIGTTPSMMQQETSFYNAEHHSTYQPICSYQNSYCLIPPAENDQNLLQTNLTPNKQTQNSCEDTVVNKLDYQASKSAHKMKEKTETTNHKTVQNSEQKNCDNQEQLNSAKPGNIRF